MYVVEELAAVSMSAARSLLGAVTRVDSLRLISGALSLRVDAVTSAVWLPAATLELVWSEESAIGSSGAVDDRKARELVIEEIVAKLTVLKQLRRELPRHRVPRDGRSRRKESPRSS